MNRISALVLFCLCTLLGACSTVDRDTAQTLGTAGERALSTLSSQTATSEATLDVLDEWWTVHDALVCVNARAGAVRTACLKNAAGSSAQIHPPELDQDRLRLADVMMKRKQAVDQLASAYSAFVDLAKYDAAGEAARALGTSFEGINALSKAAASIAPQGATFPLITSTFEKAAAGIVALSADERQSQLLLAASRDLHRAVDVLIGPLTAERDKAASQSLLAELEAERGALYLSGIDAGFIDPTDIVGQIFSHEFPGLKLATPPPANQTAIKAAAVAAVKAHIQAQQEAIVQSYDAALSALQALSNQHRAFETEGSIDVAAIEAEVARLQAAIASVTSVNTPEK